MAGRGKSIDIKENIEKECIIRKMEYEFRYITKEVSGADIAREYASEENVIYVVGGDGSITKTIQGIVGTKNRLGIIPAGSGNDTYKSVKKLPEGNTLIDIAKINSVYFINVACLGIDAEVGNNIDIFREKNIPTSQLYNASIFYTFRHFKFKKMNFKSKIKNISEEFSILSICNGAYYGGGFNVAPKSKLTDGLLDIYFGEKIPKIAMIPLLLKLKKGEHEGKRHMHKFRTDHVELELNEMVTFNVDGEKLTDKKFVIDVLPKAICVYNNADFVEKSIIKIK
jgi:YegS/Rv2252/BmrU family lipid kinase